MKAWLVIVFCVMGILPLVQGQVANDDFYTAPAGTPFAVSAPGVLANDTGPGSLAATLVTGPANGTLTLNADGSFIYTPTNNFTGADGFTYQAISDSLTSGVATVVISVTAPGEVFYDNFARPAGADPSFPWIQEQGTWKIADNLINGTGSISNYAYAYYQNANWTNYSVQAQIRFSANNAASAGILGELDPTSGAHYAVWIYPEESTEFLASGNGTALLRLIKYDVWGWPYYLIGNAVTLPGMGVNWHTVKLAFQGSNIFAYFDGNLVTNVTDNGSIDGYPAFTQGGIGLNLWTLPAAAYTFSVANVIVSTTSNSIANYDSYNATSNLTLDVAAPGVLANDTGNGSLTAILVSGPADGSLTLTNNGGFSYTPTNGFIGTDGFTYQCTDGQTTSGVATVIITVNNAPVANNDNYSMVEDTTLSVGTPGVLANDPGGNGPLTAVLATGPADGSLNLNTNGSFSYTPTSGFAGVDSFTYQCTDGQTTSGVAIVTITVNNGIQANNHSYSVEEDTTLTVKTPGVLANDTGGKRPLTAVLATKPADGSLTLSKKGG
ncbi:MAG TPA: Ig-like domain-containing protein, partial [Phycisphaerae bacterium]|nr:Ig-like domain-containing protein [Phycisphaerae bacterium]